MYTVFCSDTILPDDAMATSAILNRNIEQCTVKSLQNAVPQNLTASSRRLTDTYSIGPTQWQLSVLDTPQPIRTRVSVSSQSRVGPTLIRVSIQYSTRWWDTGVLARTQVKYHIVMGP